METPFERLAQVLDNASANYLAAEQRKARLADQRGYDGAVLADARAYEQTQEAKQREQALIAAGYLTKPLGQNTPEEIATAVATASAHALAIRNEEAETRRETGAKREHDAKARKREEQTWELNPVKSQDRTAMEKEVDGGMIDFGKPAAMMTDEELGAAYAKTHADAIKRGDSGVRYATQIEQEIQNTQALTDTTPTAAELRAARAQNAPRSMSKEDREAAEQAAQQMAGQAAMQRAAFANVRLKGLTDIREALIRTKQFPNEIPAALAPQDSQTPPTAAPAPTTLPAALGLDDEVKRDVVRASVDKDWPQIHEDYQLAALGDDAIRERINKPMGRIARLSRGSYDPVTFTAPTPAVVAARLASVRADQDEARQRLRRRRGDLALYAPEDPERAKQLASILALFPQENAVTQNAFNSVAAKQ